MYENKFLCNDIQVKVLSRRVYQVNNKNKENDLQIQSYSFHLFYYLFWHCSEYWCWSIEHIVVPLLIGDGYDEQVR